MTNDSLMKVKCIAECSTWSILQYLWPALSDNRSWKPFTDLFESGRFTQVYCRIVSYWLGAIDLHCFMVTWFFFYYSLCTSQYSQEFTCSVILGKDLVPRLGIQTMEDLKAQLLTAIHDCDQPKVSDQGIFCPSLYRGRILATFPIENSPLFSPISCPFSQIKKSTKKKKKKKKNLLIFLETYYLWETMKHITMILKHLHLSGMLGIMQSK